MSVSQGVEATVIVGNEAYTLQSDKIVFRSKTDAFNFNLKLNNENILLTGALQDDKVCKGIAENRQCSHVYSTQSIRIQSSYLDNGKPYNDLYVVANFPETFGLPEIVDVQCKSKGTGPVACRMLLSTDNAALVLMQQGKFTSEVEIVAAVLRDS